MYVKRLSGGRRYRLCDRRNGTDDHWREDVFGRGTFRTCQYHIARDYGDGRRHKYTSYLRDEFRYCHPGRDDGQRIPVFGRDRFGG